RSEYGRMARALENVIETASQQQIQAFVSEEIQHGKDWRQSIEEHLRAAQSLFLIYGAPYEDWSWGFYETGYFASLNPKESDGKIYGLIRPNISPPGPLAHLQMVTGKDQLVDAITELYQRNNVAFDAGDLRKRVDGMAHDLFGEIRQYEGYPRVHL